jgi:SAM-dependent methyltransferase
MFDLTVHKSPHAQAHVKVTVVLVDRGGRKQRALDWLARQTLPRVCYELMWIELHETPSPAAKPRADWVVCCNQKGSYHLHKGLNAAMLLAAGSIVAFCDADATGPDDFIQSIVEHFDRPRAVPLLRHRGTSGAEGAVSMRREDVIRFGGYDEHPLWRDAAGNVGDLIRRMLANGGVERWHERIGIDVPVASEPFSAAVVAQNAERAELEAFAPRRLLPLMENPAIRSTRLGFAQAAAPADATAVSPAARKPPVATAPVHSAPQPARADPMTPIDSRDIPVFIVNRNRCEALQRLVSWLLAAGTRRVVILDNASTYPPLLKYYDTLPTGAKVMRLEENFGPYVFWQQGVHQVIDTPYVVTDSDVVPADFCPSDLIGRLHAALQRYPDVTKVGPALRIDDLPDGYMEADTVRKWESQFWEHPVAPGVFAAPIDTTFALYPANAEFSNDERSLRLGHPYIAEHTPWYAEEHRLSDEERYYREHTSTRFSNWSVSGKTSWVDKSARVLGYDDRARVLNLDGRGETIPGWTNAAPAGRRADLDFDWTRAATDRLPVPDDHFDGIRVNHVLEEVRDAQALLAELHRVAKPGARLQVRVAHGSHAAAWADPGSRRAWGEGSFGFFAQPGLPLSASVEYDADWSPDDVRVIEEGADDSSALSLLVTMTAVKPARARAAARSAPAVSRRVADDRLDPGFARV